MRQQLSKLLTRILLSAAAWPVLGVVLALCAVGLRALQQTAPAEFQKQQVHVLIGLGAMLLAMLVNYERIGQYAYLIYGAAVALLAAVLVTPAIKGSHRWFSLGAGVMFQPSEVAKIAFVLALAWYLRYRKDLRTLRGLIMPCLLTLVPMGLIVVEPDLGTSLLFPSTLYAMLIAAGARFRHLILILLIVGISVPSLYPFLRPYQKQRIVSLLSRQRPTQKLLQTTGYQQHQSVIAIGSGGVTGQREKGADLLRHGLVPESHTDFIYAVINALWGFAGGLLVQGLYLAFFGGCLQIAAGNKEPFGRLLVVGLASQMMVQAVANMAMTVGLGPVVGIALPFLSYGGSAMLTTMLAVGLILNVAIRRPAKIAHPSFEYAN